VVSGSESSKSNPYPDLPLNASEEEVNKFFYGEQPVAKAMYWLWRNQGKRMAMNEHGNITAM